MHDSAKFLQDMLSGAVVASEKARRGRYWERARRLGEYMREATYWKWNMRTVAIEKVTKG